MDDGAGGGASNGGHRLHPSPLPDPPPQGGREGAEDDVDWAEVRRAYELGGESVAAIRNRFGLTPSQLRKRREAENWTLRAAAAKPGPRQGQKPLGAEAVEYRLNRLVTVGLAMLEKQISVEGMTEANARTLTELVRAQEITMRIKRNEKAAKAREKKNKDAGHDFRDDPEWLLAEVNRRLDRLGARAGARDAAEAHPEGEGSAGA